MKKEDLIQENAALKQQLKNQTQFCDPYCFAAVKKDEEIAELKTIIKDLHKIDTDDYDVQGHVPVIDWDKILKQIGGQG